MFVVTPFRGFRLRVKKFAALQPPEGGYYERTSVGECVFRGELYREK